MPFDTYVHPDDRDPQVDIIAKVELVNDQNINPQNYRAGICFMLSTNWALRCIQDSGTAPNLVWRAMRRENIYYFKQIAQQQVGLLKYFWSGDWFKAATDAVELGSRNAHHVKKLAPNDSTNADIPALASLVKAGLVSSTTGPKLVLIFFNCRGGAHCIAAARVHTSQGDGVIYLYDPNLGVAIIDESRGHSLATVLGDMNAYFNYQIAKSQVVPLT
ncbi:MAG: hypothetical protein ACK4GK_08505 [Ferrovibrio sp.]|jgi:hypothetical protein